MSEIRLIKGEEYAAARRIWDICFPEDAGEYAEYYFSRRTAAENVVGAFEEGELAACLHVIPQRITVRGRSLPIGMIAGVGTLPEFRRRGLAGEMLAAAKELLRKRGAYGAMLQPVNTAYYTSSGFVPYSVKDIYIVKGGGGSFRESAGAAELLDIYRYYASDFDGMRERSLRDMELLMEEWEITGCRIAAGDGTYIAYYVKDGAAHATEAAGRDIGGLAEAVAARHGSLRIELPEGVDISGEKTGRRVFSMMAFLGEPRERGRVCSLEYC